MAEPRQLQVKIGAASLEGLDRLAGEDLVAFAGADERPLRGLAGLVDWRMCGELTRRLRDGIFLGASGETLLTIAGGRLPIGRLFLVGRGLDPPSTKLLESALLRVRLAGGKRAAIAWVGTAIDAPLRAAHQAGLEGLTLLAIDTRGAQKALEAALGSLSWLRMAKEGPSRAASD